METLPSRHLQAAGSARNPIAISTSPNPPDLNRQHKTEALVAPTTPMVHYIAQQVSFRPDMLVIPAENFIASESWLVAQPESVSTPPHFSSFESLNSQVSA